MPPNTAQLRKAATLAESNLDWQLAGELWTQAARTLTDKPGLNDLDRKQMLKRAADCLQFAAEAAPRSPNDPIRDPA